MIARKVNRLPVVEAGRLVGMVVIGVLGYVGALLTAIYTALIVWIVGLAVPVTASYIICAVIAAPALMKLGVPDYAAHMFIFYYAVLSEVSPPTALSPFAAAAITGGNPFKTMMLTWKYTLPAFLVPLAFVLMAGSGAWRSFWTLFVRAIIAGWRGLAGRVSPPPRVVHN